MNVQEKRYLELLAKLFPTKAACTAEIINLNAILNLPKGTEFFVSDIHGEYDAFSHTLKNASGFTRLEIDKLFADSMSEEERREFATLVYYPKEKTAQILNKKSEEEARAWLQDSLLKLTVLSREFAQQYTKSRVRKALPREHAYIMEELIFTDEAQLKNGRYHSSIIKSIIDTGTAPNMVEAFAELIQYLAIDELHVVGDIYDRGPAPHVIMDMLADYHDVDIQWGNHDIVWMGASLGQRGCIAHVVRNCARYGNLSILEDAYGINILPLAGFALRAYADDPCVAFGLKGSPSLPPHELETNIKIQKAMSIIEFKVEGAIIDEHPEYGLDDRKLLHKIDYDSGTVELDGKVYELKDKIFPTIDPKDPYRLTDEEEAVMSRLESAFTGSEKLQRHMRLLLEKGSLYKVYNDTLMFHACVPMNPDGTLMDVNVTGENLSGKALYDAMEAQIKAAFTSEDEIERKKGRDMLWYLWLGPGSPLFAKSKMATFELYLIEDSAARKEVKNSFYSLLSDEEAFNRVFLDFGLDPKVSHIVCGHVPVKVKDGEDPVKCNGRVFTIDGGYSKAYQPTTGIAGYTLISNSNGFMLAAHEPLSSVEDAIEKCVDIHSSKRIIEEKEECRLISNTDKGAKIKKRISDLEALLKAYRKGDIKEAH